VSRETRLGWIDTTDEIPVTRQCELAQVARATVYAQREERTTNEVDLRLCRMIDEEYTRRPFYGSRRMVVHLASLGELVNRKRVQRLMRQMGLWGMAPGPNTSVRQVQHKIYPYLLRGVEVERPNQVWSTDITYIRLARGFAYLVAVIDWYSRKVLSWRISNSMDARFCVDCLEDALSQYGRPEIFNSDQGSQFTSEAFTGVLLRASVTISMDGRGRALDNIFVERLWRNVKYEDVYLKGYATMGELTVGLAQYFAYYNSERPHQSLGYQPPDAIYQSGCGGGARIVDRFSKVLAVSPVPLRCTSETARTESGQRRAAADEVATT
jgi:putative transposase